MTRQLSVRQVEVLKLVGLGFEVKEIAALLRISPKTVEVHKHSAYQMCAIKKTSHATLFCIATGIILPEEIEALLQTAKIIVPETKPLEFNHIHTRSCYSSCSSNELRARIARTTKKAIGI